MSWIGFKDKKLWDWVELLIVPALLTFLSFFITSNVNKRQQEIENQRYQQSVMREYLKDMTELSAQISSPNKSIKNAGTLRPVASARTLTALNELDKEGRRQLMEFLSNAGLLQQIHLRRANLEGTDLSFLWLKDADMQNSNLKNTKFYKANIGGANLKYAAMNDADFREAVYDKCTLVENQSILEQAGEEQRFKDPVNGEEEPCHYRF